MARVGPLLLALLGVAAGALLPSLEHHAEQGLLLRVPAGRAVVVVTFDADTGGQPRASTPGVGGGVCGDR